MAKNISILIFADGSPILRAVFVLEKRNYDTIKKENEFYTKHMAFDEALS